MGRGAIIQNDGTVVYALQYDIDYGNYEISGIYRTLEAAMNAVPNLTDWRKDESKAFWEAIIKKTNSFDYHYWCIEAHILQ